jgi:hypothetical protein
MPPLIRTVFSRIIRHVLKSLMHQNARSTLQGGPSRGKKVSYQKWQRPVLILIYTTPTPGVRSVVPPAGECEASQPRQREKISLLFPASFVHPLSLRNLSCRRLGAETCLYAMRPSCMLDCVASDASRPDLASWRYCLFVPRLSYSQMRNLTIKGAIGSDCVVQGLGSILYCNHQASPARWPCDVVLPRAFSVETLCPSQDTP